VGGALAALGGAAGFAAGAALLAGGPLAGILREGAFLIVVFLAPVFFVLFDGVSSLTAISLLSLFGWGAPNLQTPTFKSWH
jgi:hypothetical protein